MLFDSGCSHCVLECSEYLTVFEAAKVVWDDRHELTGDIASALRAYEQGMYEECGKNLGKVVNVLIDIKDAVDSKRHEGAKARIVAPFMRAQMMEVKMLY